MSRCALICLAAIAIALIGGRVVYAHAILEETNPAADSVVPVSPRMISLRFNEPVSLAADPVRVLDIDGRRVDLDDAAAIDTTVTVSLPPSLPNGSYIVTWRVISTDTHPVAGAFTFAVGSPSVSASGSSASDVLHSSAGSGTGSQASVNVASGLVALGVLLAAGSVAFTILALPVALPRAADRVLTLARASALLAVAASAALVSAEAMLFQSTRLAWPSVASLRHELRGPVGLQTVLVVAGSVLLLASLHRLRTFSAPRTVAAAIGSGLALCALAVVGHTRTVTPLGLVVATDIAHVTAAAIWVGGVVALLVYLWRAAHERGAEPPGTGEQASVVARFSAVATVAILVVMVAGLILGWRIVGSIHALFATRYGTLLLIKAGLFAIVAAIGAYNRFRLVPRIVATDDVKVASSHLRRTLVAESATMVLIIAVTAVLTNTSPNAAAVAASSGHEHSHYHTDDATDSSVEPEQSVAREDSFGDGSATVTVSPARIGSNLIVITLTDAAGKPLHV